MKRLNLLPLALLTSLCAASYILGISHHHGGGGGGGGGGSAALTAVPCRDGIAAEHGFGEATALDFAAHHAAGELAVSVAEAREFLACDARYSEYTPCEDRDRSLRFDRDRLIYRERHCPEKGEQLKCLVPAPPGYRSPPPWPESRGAAWFANVPHKELTVEKAVQNWVKVEGDKFVFPGGGTMFPNGADAYIDEIGRLIPLRDGSIRTAIDTGCGVASWGASLLSRGILTMSLAPRDTHEAQVQFALERGVPAMIGVLASNRLPFPARAFDMAHCSRCLIPWHLYDGLYLIEIDRILRPGGYWILSGPPINWRRHWKGWERTQDDLNSEQSAIENITRSLCWKKIKESGDIAVWRKPTNHIHCKITRRIFRSPRFCPADSSPDAAWYAKMEPCITPLPQAHDIKQVAGGELARWPERAAAAPPRIASGSVAGVSAEAFAEDAAAWRRRVGFYKAAAAEQLRRRRNVLDMNARLGGFAAALVGEPVWVMNVVPTAAPVDTLGVIYERGLIGTYHDW
ncbi:putative methyltransferase PMT15 [Ananas comosus]|uniref:Methyltransferase n=1 Tax=Ananas comosus TaxID=4615 RepID=A0A199UY79_ANACO|nr:putative methyltransferase PMT15 [Ananas comosus]